MPTRPDPPDPPLRRVLYDLRYATDHFPGVGTHAWELLRALLALPGPERYAVVWNDALANGRFDVAQVRSHPRVDWISTRVPALGLATARGTGALARASGADVFMSPFWIMPDRPGMPVVLTLHDVLPLVEGHPISWWRRELFRVALRRARGASAILTSSRFSGGELARRAHLPPERVHVVPLGVAVAPVEATRPPAAPEAPFALAVGVNKPQKNLAVLADAWRAMGADAPLALVSAGPVDARYPALESLARDLPRVTALGRVAPGELEWLYRHATALLLPSVYEGFGFPLLEGMARGVPVLAGDIPPLRELGEGVAEFLPPRDAGAWMRAVRAIASDAAKREVMRVAGPPRAAEYSHARCAENVLALLRRVCAPHA